MMVIEDERITEIRIELIKDRVSRSENNRERWRGM